MKWKHVLRYPFDIRIAEKHLSAGPPSRLNCDDVTIGLDLFTDQMLFDCGRHLTCIAASANKIDSHVVLRCNRLMLAAIAHKSHGRQFLSMPNVRWISPHESFPSDSLVLMDIDRSCANRSLDGQRSVAMLIGREVVPQAPVMPYPMHPNQINESTDQRVESFRSQPKAGIFFAGNQKTRYGRETMQNEFGVLPRLAILSELRRCFPDRIAARDSAGSDDRIVLRDSATDPIAGKDWMTVLAAHRFFLCCPGASQPVCHNVIEAMSVGAIPLIEYSDRFHPELVDGVNAICFQGCRGLVDAVRRIDSMSEQKRSLLTENVCDYFDEHLDGATFLKRLRDSRNTDSIDQISMPFHDRNFFSPESAPSGRAPIGHTRAA